MAKVLDHVRMDSNAGVCMQSVVEHYLPQEKVNSAGLKLDV